MMIARTACVVTVASLVFLQALHADQWVRRKTASSASDLIGELLARGMIDIASKICDRHLAEAQSDDDEKAKWLIESSRSHIAAMLRSDSGDQEQKLASDAINKFLSINSEHKRRLWLQFQRELVELAATRRAVMVAIVKPPNDPTRDEALKSIVSVGVRLRELSQSIESEIAIERSKKVDDETVQELLALAVVVANKRIESIMLRGEMFEKGSNDFIASATESLKASQELVSSLPVNAPSRDELIEKIAESLRRTGELDEAWATISSLLKADRNNPSRRAIAAKIAIDQGDFSKARDLLAESDESNEVPHIDLELARLQLTIATAADKKNSTESQREIADRIELIGKRFGAYARRRAEQLVLGTVLPNSPQELDPRLLIAQAANRIRSGQAGDAAQWLATASRAARDPDSAIQLAVAGAAAFRHAKDLKNASALLRETSLARFENQEAAKLHLQSSVLASEVLSPDSLIESLEECISTWPEDPVAVSATDWLVRLHEARGDTLQAARATGLADISTMTSQSAEKAGELWLQAISKAKPDERVSLASEAVTAMLRSKTEATEKQSARLVVLFGDPAILQSIASKSLEAPWLTSLFQIRSVRAFTEFKIPESIDDLLRHAVAERLMLDGQASRLNRETLARAILSLDKSEESLVSAQAWIWMKNWRRADEVVGNLLKKHPNDFEIAHDAATILCAADDKEAKLLGQKLWMNLSSQLPQGTAQWHEAKLAVIASLRAIGEDKQASQMAEYILLTQPPPDAQTMARYEAMK